MKSPAPGDADFPGADDTAADAPVPDLEQVAGNTSRKLLILVGAGAILLYLFNATPIGRQIRDWDTLAGIFNAPGWRGVPVRILSLPVASCRCSPASCRWAPSVSCSSMRRVRA